MNLKPVNTAVCKDPLDPWAGKSWETDNGDLIEITLDRNGWKGRLNEREEIRNQSSLESVMGWLENLLSGRLTAGEGGDD